MSSAKGRVKADPVKQGWEDVEFPILCETCLGDNPYVRMTREKYGSACHVCERPATKFRWKAGSGGRFKVTVVCAACSKMKNVCQCCILDLQYGVPVEVRDRVVAQAMAQQQVPAGGGQPLGSGGLPPALIGFGGSGSVPTSDVNRQYAIAQFEAAEAKGGGVVPYSGVAAMAPAAHEALLRLGRTKAHYARNAAKLCSFFARGECTRGAECPYRHEMPRDADDALSKQDYKSRFYGTDDPVAARILGKMHGQQQQQQAAAAGEGGGQPHASDDDPSAVTLWVGRLDAVGAPAASSEELRLALLGSGEVLGVHVSEKAASAFAEFVSHAAAAAALRSLQAAGGLELRGQRLPVSWARGPRGAEGLGGGGGGGRKPHDAAVSGGSGANATVLQHHAPAAAAAAAGGGLQQAPPQAGYYAPAGYYAGYYAPQQLWQQQLGPYPFPFSSPPYSQFGYPYPVPPAAAAVQTTLAAPAAAVTDTASVVVAAEDVMAEEAEAAPEGEAGADTVASHDAAAVQPLAQSEQKAELSVPASSDVTTSGEVPDAAAASFGGAAPPAGAQTVSDAPTDAVAAAAHVTASVPSTEPTNAAALAPPLAYFPYPPQLQGIAVAPWAAMAAAVVAAGGFGTALASDRGGGSGGPVRSARQEEASARHQQMSPVGRQPRHPHSAAYPSQQA